jgi:hypothetical protein
MTQSYVTVVRGICSQEVKEVTILAEKLTMILAVCITDIY